MPEATVLPKDIKEAICKVYPSLNDLAVDGTLNKINQTFSAKHTFLTHKKTSKLTQNFCKKFWFNHFVLNICT